MKKLEKPVINPTFKLKSLQIRENEILRDKKLPLII